MPQPLVAVDLTPATARLWVEAGPPVPDAAEAEAAVRAFIEAGHPGALVAVLDGNRPLARLQASPVGSCGIGLFAVGFREGLDDATAQAAGTVMLDGAAGGSSTVVVSVALHGPQPLTLHACTR